MTDRIQKGNNREPGDLLRISGASYQAALEEQPPGQRSLEAPGFFIGNRGAEEGLFLELPSV